MDYSVVRQTLGGLQSLAGSDELPRQWTAPSPGGGAHGEGKGESVSVPVDLGMVWGCRWLLLVLRLWVCGVLVGGMGGAGRRELPPRVAQGAVRGIM